MNLVLLAVCALVAVAFLWRQYVAGAEERAFRQAGAAVKFLVTIVALVPILMLLVSLWNVVTPFSYRVLVDSFDNYRTPNSPVTEPSSADVPTRRTVDQNELRTEYFINGPKRWGWETLPTEVEVAVLIDGVARFTGLNVALMEDCDIRVSCPGYNQDQSYAIFLQEGTGRWFPLSRSDEEFVVTGLGNLHGAYMSYGRVSSSRNPGRVHYTMQATPKEGHTRIATWKVAEGGYAPQWGILPDPAKFKWNLYMRFADEAGMTITPSVMQQNPGAIRVGKLAAAQGEGEQLSPTFEKLLSEPERVYGEYIAKGEDRFLAIGTPDLAGKKVRIEVILDILPR